MQFTVALAVGCASIYAGRKLDYPINPMIIAAWSGFAALGATYLVLWLTDWRERRLARRLARRLEAGRGGNPDPGKTLHFKRPKRLGGTWSS